MAVFSVQAQNATATLSFADKAQRTTYTTSQQVWEQDGITFTNNKSNSTTNVADYAAPARFYKNSEIIVECSLGNITQIVFTCNSSSYASALGTSISGSTVSGSNVTVALDGTSNSYTISSLTGGQVRMDEVTVTYTTTGGEGGDTPDPVDVAEPTFTPTDGETFEESLAVTINAEDGLTVYYSTDNKVSYTEGNTVNITETTTVYAYAEDAEGNQSDVVEATYTKVDPNAKTAEVVSKDLRYENAADVTEIKIGDYITVTFENGTSSNATKYYNTGYGIRNYNGNIITFTAAQGVTINSIVLTAAGTSYMATPSNLSSGTFTKEGVVTTISGVNSGELSYVQSSNTSRIQKFEVNYSIQEGVVVISTPSIAGGETFVGSTTVEITNNADGTTLFYSTDGVNYYEYTDALNITETTTVYAYAQDGEGNKSSVAEATFTALEIVTIAEAKAAYDAAGANTDVYINLAGCVVTVNSGKYLYIQDSESGINIYSSGATYPAGTKFTAGILSGTSTVYNGMHQISGASFSDDVTTEAETVAVTPIDVTVAQLNSDYAAYEGRYVKLSGVALAGTTITQGNDTYTLYNRFTITVEDAATCDIIGIPACYGTTLQIYPTEIVLPLVAELPSVSVADGSEIELGSKIVITPAAGNAVTYSVNGAAAVAIDGETVITAENVGAMTLVVTSTYGGNTLTATYTYTVKAAVAKVTTALTSEEIIALGKSSSKYEDIEVPSASGVWTGLSYINKAGYLQLRSDNGEYIQSPEFLGDVKSITLVINNTSVRTFTFTSGEVELGTLTNDGVAGEKITLNVETAGVKSFKVVANGTTQISDIEVVYEQPAPFKLNVGSTGYATLCLGCDATIPVGVECYTVASVENGYVSLAKIDDTLLPAYTAVIVKAEANVSYTFNYGNIHTATVAGNFLKGTVATTDITPAENTVYYVLANGTEGVGLYKDELNGDIFRNNANKAYLPVVVETEANAAASYSFNFDWNGTTGIEGVVAEGAEDGAIYDITGRRVKAITAPGIYIVNGKKVVK